MGANKEEVHIVIMKAIPLRAKALSGINYHRNWFGRSVRLVLAPINRTKLSECGWKAQIRLFKFNLHKRLVTFI